MERCSTTLVIRVMQIKTIMKHHLIPVKMSIMNKCTNDINAIESMEKRELSYNVGGNVSWYSHF